MPTCKTCGCNFPNRVKIDGKPRNLSSRRHCLDCVPRGSRKASLKDGKPCSHCGRTDTRKEPQRNVCYVCRNKERTDRKTNRLYKIVGEACWFCGYNKGRQMLDFHHVRDKEFMLTARNVGQLAWKRTLSEAKKCALCCCRCHREIHYGLISDEEVMRVYTDRWKVP